MKYDINLFGMTTNELRDSLRKTEIALEARATLAQMVKVIHQAGGAISEEELALSPVGDLAIMAAHNNLKIIVDQKIA